MSTNFKVGENIVHIHHGVGKIEKIDNKTIDGKKQKYYKVSTSSTIYWLLVEEDQSYRIRPIASKYMFRKAGKLLTENPPEIEVDHKKRELFIKESIEEGTLMKLAEVVRLLYLQQHIKKLNAFEENIYGKVYQQYIDEWMLSANIDQEKALDKLDILLSSLSKPVIVKK